MSAVASDIIENCHESAECLSAGNRPLADDVGSRLTQTLPLANGTEFRPGKCDASEAISCTTEVDKSDGFTKLLPSSDTTIMESCESGSMVGCVISENAETVSSTGAGDKQLTIGSASPIKNRVPSITKADGLRKNKKLHGKY
jgi:hypothetical protein